MAQDQATGEHPIARIYKALLAGKPLTTEELQVGGTELRRLNARKKALRIQTDGVLEIQLMITDKVYWSVVCPPSSTRKTVIWSERLMD